MFCVGRSMEAISSPACEIVCRNTLRSNKLEPWREPPYSVGQSSSNDNNENLKYPTLDSSIEATYLRAGSGRARGNIYDSYIRAIRWAANRVLNSPNGGIICYVSNGGYIDSNSADGLRKTLTTEFHDIYIYNLRGNQRTAGEQSRKEGGKIFDSGSRNTVAIMLLIKRPDPVTESILHYKDIGDYLDRDQKLELVNQATLGTLEWETITPNEEGDWINQRDPNYETYPPIYERGNQKTLFTLTSAGAKTNRDVWVYNSSRSLVAKNTARMIENYNNEVSRWRQAGSPQPAVRFIDPDPRKISWSTRLKNAFSEGERIDGKTVENIRVAAYRPFQKSNLIFDKAVVEAPSKLATLFPTTYSGNIGFHLTSPSTHYPTFEVLATDAVPDLHLLDTGQFFARHYYSESDSNALFGDTNAQHNITDWALSEYRKAYGNQVSKDDIFYYTYGLLHSPEYRERYSSDLKKSLPRIPQVAGDDRFEAFVRAGRDLTDLHINYEGLTPYPLIERVSPGAPEDEYERYKVGKMKYAGKAGSWDKTRIRYNPLSTSKGFPRTRSVTCLGHAPGWTGSSSGTRSRLIRLRVFSTIPMTGPSSMASRGTSLTSSAGSPP